MKTTKNRNLVLGAIFILLAGGASSALAAQVVPPKPLPKDTEGLSTYVSTFDVEDVTEFDAWTKKPETSEGRYGLLRFETRGDEGNTVEFFHGPKSQYGTFYPNDNKGVDVDLKGYFRHRLQAKLDEYKETRQAKFERIREIENELAEFDRGGTGYSKKHVEDLREEYRIQKDATQKLLRQIIRIENQVRDHSDKFEAEMQESVSSFKRIMYTMLSRCVWGAQKDVYDKPNTKFAIHTCTAGAAFSVVNELADAIDRDKKLEAAGEPYSFLKIAPLIGNVHEDESDSATIVGGNSFILGLFGLGGFDCATTDGGGTACHINSDMIEHRPDIDIDAAIASRTGGVLPTGVAGDSEMKAAIQTWKEANESIATSLSLSDVQ